MQAMVVVFACLAAFASVAALTPDVTMCGECINMLQVLEEKVKAMGNETNPNDVVLSACGTFNGDARAYCFDVLTVDAEDFVQAIRENASHRQICTEAEQCSAEGGAERPPPPVDIDTTDTTDPLPFHSAGAEELKNLTFGTTDLMQAGQSSSDSSKKSQGGLAWDKHDFDVTNNKGGNVKVEVNLQSPGGMVNDQDNLGDILALLNNASQPEEPDTDWSEMLKAMKELIPPPEDNSADLAMLAEIMKALKGLNDTPAPLPPPAPIVMPPPAPPPQHDIAAIIEALHPPPPPAQPPIDIASMMAAMKNAIMAGREPPAPPPGIDPSLLQSLLQTMKDMKDMHAEMNKNMLDALNRPQPEAPAPMPPMPYPQPTEPPHQDFHDKLAAMQARMDAMALNQRDYPTFQPQPNNNLELENLKRLMAEQLGKGSAPIVLPPPKPRPAVAVAAPPPPTAPAQLMAPMPAHVPQRIPAPPVIKIGTPSCCPVPAPEDPAGIKCPRVNGAALPRCKRKAPGTLPVKCKNRECNNKLALDAMDGKMDGKVHGTVIDSDGDEVLDVWDAAARNVVGTFPGLQTADFDPKRLLQALCPGGKCDPGSTRENHLVPARTPTSSGNTL